MTTTKTASKKKDEPATVEVPAHLRRTKDKVAIVGFAHSRVDTPFTDHDYEIWGINRLHTVMPDARWDRYFQIHDLQASHGDDEQHLNWLRAQTIPVYLRPDDMGKFGIDAAVPYPKQDMVNMFGNYFTNTISWLIAFAIALEFKEIAVYGVDMAVDMVIDSEYAYQRPSCEYFLGVAAGQGITVKIPPGSDLLKSTHLYGFETGGILREKYDARIRELAQRKAEQQNQLAQLDAQRGQMIAAINQIEGAAQDVQYWLRNWSQSPPTSPTTIEATTGD